MFRNPNDFLLGPITTADHMRMAEKRLFPHWELKGWTMFKDGNINSRMMDNQFSELDIKRFNKP